MLHVMIGLSTGPNSSDEGTVQLFGGACTPELTEKRTHRDEERQRYG